MSEEKITNANFIHLSVPLQYVKVYASILAALSDYGEDMLEDCKASCTDKDSGIIECFNMFNAAIAAFRLDEIKKADTIISYIESTIQLKYKNIVIPDSISFPVEEENVTINFDFNNPPYFEMIEGIPIPLESLEIEGDNIVIGVSSRYTCKFTPENATDKNIVWDIPEGQGNQYAFIDSQTGVLYVKQNANNSQVVVRVTSVDNPEISDTKTVRCTYQNVAQGYIRLIVNTDLAEYNTQKNIQAIVEDAVSTPVRLELYQIDDSDNIILINYVENTSTNIFNVTLKGLNRYFVKAVFDDSTELVSDIVELDAVPCCYIGVGASYVEVLSNPANKLNPILDIGSEVGKEYPVTVTEDGQFIFIIVPRLQGHMDIDEIRLDETNLSEGFYFDVDYSQEDIVLSGNMYGVYGVKLHNKGFRHGNYRLLITE